MSAPEVHPDRAHLRAFALGDLSAAGARRVEAHLHHCAACRGTVVALREELVALVDELPPVEPHSGSFALVQARTRRRAAWAPWLAAAAVALAVATAGWGVRERNLAVGARQRQAVVAGWLARPDLQVLTLRDRQRATSGRVLLASGRRALFVLPPPPPGEVYHAWVGMQRGWKYGDPVRLAGSSRSGVFEVALGSTDYLCFSLEREARPARPSHVIGWTSL